MPFFWFAHFQHYALVGGNLGAALGKILKFRILCKYQENEEQGPKNHVQLVKLTYVFFILLEICPQIL